MDYFQAGCEDYMQKSFSKSSISLHSREAAVLISCLENTADYKTRASIVRSFFGVPECFKYVFEENL
jgi:hypothetical protein